MKRLLMLSAALCAFSLPVMAKERLQCSVRVLDKTGNTAYCTLRWVTAEDVTDCNCGIPPMFAEASGSAIPLVSNFEDPVDEPDDEPDDEDDDPPPDDEDDDPPPDDDENDEDDDPPPDEDDPEDEDDDPPPDEDDDEDDEGDDEGHDNNGHGNGDEGDCRGSGCSDPDNPGNGPKNKKP